MGLFLIGFLSSCEGVLWEGNSVKKTAEEETALITIEFFTNDPIWIYRNHINGNHELCPEHFECQVNQEEEE